MHISRPSEIYKKDTTLISLLKKCSQMLDTIGQYKKICIEYTPHDLSELCPGTEYNPQPSEQLQETSYS
jgi:hypothetical protein